MSEQDNVKGWSWDETLINRDAVSSLSAVTFALLALSVFNSVEKAEKHLIRPNRSESVWRFYLVINFEVWDEILKYVFMSFANLNVVESCYIDS